MEKSTKIYLVIFTVAAILLFSNIYLHVKVNNLHQAIKQKHQPTAVSDPTPHTTPPIEKADTKETVNDAASARIMGCDVSHWDGEIDWTKLKKAGVKFIYQKATQGTEYIDPTFEENWASAKNYGVIRGAYHFYDPKADPEVQAAHFLNVVKFEKGDLLPVLDIEIASGVSPDELSKNIGIWIEKVQAAIGRPPIIYTYRYFWDASINQDFSHCPLWIAEYENNHAPYIPNGWKDWIMWQYSSKGTLPGIPDAVGKVDLDHFKGDLQALKTYQIR